MATEEPYLQAIVTAVQRGKDAERDKQAAVLAARLAGVSWTPIGRALEVSRQAARDKYLAGEQLAKAWKRLEFLLSDIARSRDEPASTAQMVDRLVAEGALSARDSTDLRLILHRYAEVAGGASVTTREAELLTDKAVTLSAVLFLMSNSAATH